MKTKLLLILCVSVCLGFFATACNKEDDSMEKCEYEYVQYWDLQCINEVSVPQVSYHSKIPYILKFINDTTFQLNTSANVAKGNYYKISESQLVVKNFHEYTEVYNTNEKERDFDEMLLKSLNNKTFNFSYTKDKIVLQNDTITIIFSPREFIPSVLYSDDE